MYQGKCYNSTPDTWQISDGMHQELQVVSQMYPTSLAGIPMDILTMQVSDTSALSNFQTENLTLIDNIERSNQIGKLDSFTGM